MYSITDYGRMIADPGRNAAYVAALERAVTPGCTVLDIGAGAGFMALKAAQLGAARVYAVEPNPAVHVVNEVAESAGLADRIRVLQAPSHTLELPEQVDVMVSDLRGNIPLIGGHIPAIIDARTRLLRPGGVQIPERDELWAALVRVPELVKPWRVFREPTYGLDMTPTNRFGANTIERTHLERADVATDPALWRAIDYTTVSHSDFANELRFEVATPQTVHAVAMWFVSELLPGIGFTAAPGTVGTVYRSQILPFPEELDLEVGDGVDVTIRATLSGNTYTWTWDSVVQRRDGRETRYRQSNLLGTPRSMEELRRRLPEHVTELSEAGRADLLILGLLAEGTPLGRVARELTAQYPALHGSYESALGKVGDVAEEYRIVGNRHPPTS